MRAVTGSDLLLFAEAYLRLTWSVLYLKVRPSKVLRTALEERHPASNVEADIERIGAMTAAAARRHFLRPACLARSVALQAMLERRGVAAAVRVSLARTPERALSGHAWVEVNGKVINDHPDLAGQHRLTPLPADVAMPRIHSEEVKR